VLSDESLAIDMLRNLRRIARESKSEAFRVELEDSVARTLIGTAGAGLDELEHETSRAFDVVGRTDVPRDHFEVLAEGTLAEIGAEAPPCSPGDELKLPLLEPHRFVETDAVSRLSAGYEVQVVGGLPYVGTTQRLRIERATRFAAQAALMDVEPARPVAPLAPRSSVEDIDGEPVDKVSDLLEPERRVGERVDVEGRVRRQKRRTQAEQRREKGGRSGGGEGAGGGGGRGRGDGAKKKAPTATTDSESDGAVENDGATGTTEDSEAAAKRRRRRGGRGRRGRGGSGGARTPGETGTDEVVTNGAPSDPAAAAAAPVSESREPREPREPGAAGTPRPRQRRRRSGGGGGANGAAASGGAERESAPAAPPTPSEGPSSRPAPAAQREPTARDAAAANEEERRKGLISRILGR
jgi:hypothetical protein